MKIFSVAHVPEDLQQAWLQHLRDFDTAHPGCHFEVGMEGGPELTMQEMIERMRVEPALTFAAIFEDQMEIAMISQDDPFPVFDTCPDCSGFLFRPGPCGGLSQNIECVGCGSRFNIACWHGVPIFSERISNNGEWREDIFPKVLQ